MLKLLTDIRCDFWFITGLLTIFGHQMAENIRAVNLGIFTGHVPSSAPSILKARTIFYNGGFKRWWPCLANEGISDG